MPARVPDPPDPDSVPGYKRAWRWWLGKALIIGAKQNRIFAWLAYYLGLSWVGWWFRFTKQDRLDRSVLPVGESGWKERDKAIDTEIRTARRPF